MTWRGISARPYRADEEGDEAAASRDFADDDCE
jgi:hypothetical protein